MSKLIRRAKLAGKILRFVPFLRMAGLNGSVVRGEETKQSDIDILIIAKSGRLYTTRFFATLLIQLTGHRRHGSKTVGKVCLNCYLNDRNPDIIPEDKKDLLKVAKAYKHMILLVDSDSAKKFYKKNTWFDQYEVKGKIHSQILRELVFDKFPLKVKNKLAERFFWGKLGDIIERKLMQFQIKRIFKSKQKGDQIYADKFTIKLHPKKH